MALCIATGDTQMQWMADPPFPVGLRPPSFNDFTDMTRTENPGVLFLMSSSQGLFDVVMEGYSYMPVLDFWDKTGIFLLNSGMWITKGLQPPDIVASISSGLDVGLYELALNWLPSVVFYGFFAYILGIWMLSSKELDKVQK